MYSAQKSSERLLELMVKYNLTQNDIVKRTGMNKSSVSMYVSGKRNMGRKVIEKIADCYNISSEWLMGYDVSMTSKEAVHVFLEKSDVQDAQKRFLNYYLLLSETDKSLIDSMMERMLNDRETRE